VGLGLS